MHTSTRNQLNRYVLGSTPSSHPFPHPLTFILRGTLIVLLLLLSAACRPSAPEVDNRLLMEQTEEIARRYEVDGDLEGARQELERLEVANINQWLLLVLETSRREGDDEGTQRALEALSADLGLGMRTVRAQPAAPVAASVAQAVEGQSDQKARESGETATAAPATDTPAPAPTSVSSSAPEATHSPAPSATPASSSTPTPRTDPQVRLSSPMNVRAGPGTSHPVVAGLSAGAEAPIIGRDAGGTWWQIRLTDGSAGWIYGPLVESVGETAQVALAADIPTPPPPTNTPVPQPTSPPAPAPAEPDPPADPAPAAGGPDFRLTSVRLWDVAENGGFLNGTSVNCGEKQVIRVVVRDAAGNPLNGVVVKGVYRNELHTTGEKGPGIAEYDVNVDGDDIVVFRDVDGREVSSGRASGLTAKTYNISHDQLIQGQYCTDGPSCDAFIGTNGCFGHFSWTVEFQRNY